MSYRVTALYHFAHLPDFKLFRQPLLDVCHELDLKGTLLLASEGINGTVVGEADNVDKLLGFLHGKPELAGLGHKSSFTTELPFLRMKVKLKKEIVTLGVEGVSPHKAVGTYVEAKQWNQLIQDPSVFVIDTRNTYETDIGTFKGALDPRTTTFREFPHYVEQQLDPKVHTKVAMFCTGGIRCEKASSYMMEQGFDEVYHLKGGILQYLEDIPEADSLWQGECFVFDDRVTVKHDLSPGDYEMCHGCRRPLNQDALNHVDYVAGVACQYCVAEKTPEQRAAYQERQKQMELAKQRQQLHLGQKPIKPPLGDLL